MPEFDPQRLKSVRTATGLTADQTAVAIGRSISAYYKMERGDITPSMNTLCRLAEVLHCEVGAFFDADAPSHRYWLTDEQRDRIRAEVRALPPMTDEQIERIAAVIRHSRREQASA
jgi:transcriptional regulator with XRE-family HTH domain